MRCALFFLILLTVSTAFAQIEYRKNERAIDEILLKKDLQQAIEESERNPATDVSSLIYRWSLYNRAARFSKSSQILKQILNAPDKEKYSAVIREMALEIIFKENFADAETMRLYLQEISFNYDIYYRFANLCTLKQQFCDVTQFDSWLKQQILIEWRIDWRRRNKLDDSEIFNELQTAIRQNPADVQSAGLLIKNYRTAADLEWVKQNFVSKQAYEYHLLGETLAGKFRSDSARSKEERRAAGKYAVEFFQRSLSTSYNERDTELIVKYLSTATSIMPRIDDYEKQLRFWTKSSLARVYKDLGEAQSAQKIIEELAAVDKKGIQEGDINSLSGAVQAASGARVIEQKILNEEAKREDSAAYWMERIGYYHGRQETELVFDSYLKAFSAVHYDSQNEKSMRERIYLINGFASFVKDKFDDYKDRKKEMSNAENRKFLFYQKAEDILRKEFKQTAANTYYSYQLTQKLRAFGFDRLLNDILRDGKTIEIFYSQLPASKLGYDFDDLFEWFLKHSNLSASEMNAILSRMEKFALGAEDEKTLAFCEGLTAAGYSARALPILRQKLEITEKRLATKDYIADDDYKVISARDNYWDLIFKSYLGQNDWQTAEKFLLAAEKKNLYLLMSIAETAARAGAFADAVRIWKLQANLNRNNLNNLETLAKYEPVKIALRGFYEEMQWQESDSPIPALALKKLQ